MSPMLSDRARAHLVERVAGDGRVVALQGMAEVDLRGGLRARRTELEAGAVGSGRYPARHRVDGVA